MRARAFLPLALTLALVAALLAPPRPAVAQESPFAAGEILGRPTDHSVTVRAMGRVALEVALEWGVAPGPMTSTTPSVRFDAGTAIELVADGLRADTDYVYRLRYRSPGAAEFTAGSERRFHTARPPGQPFTFVIQADPHLDESSSAAVYAQTLANALADRPDFMIDLGDASMADKCAIEGANPCGRPNPATAERVLQRNLLLRSYYDRIAHSVPLFMVLGNHEAEAGWLDDGTANNINVWDTLARKSLYANPRPDGFYSGNGTESPHVGLRENYYAFEWGDALIVALDPFAYTTRKPTRATDEELWRWTLGEAQYRWLRQTLETSTARHKLVFSHHIVGGTLPEARAGASVARFFEWGGRNLDGSWGFDQQRAGWGKPIHQLLVDTGVSAWFHGHDHVYVAEELDGIVYQEVPQPSLARYDSTGPAAEYGYVGTPGVNIFASSGHLRASVTPERVRVEYVQAVPATDQTASRRNGTVLHAYELRR